MIVQKPKPKVKVTYEDVAEFDIDQKEDKEGPGVLPTPAPANFSVSAPSSQEIVAEPASVSQENLFAIPYALPPSEVPIAQPSVAVPPPYAALVANSLPVAQPKRLTLSEWLEAHGLGAYLGKLEAEDVSELSHFQDLAEEDVQALVDKWQMPLRTRRNFLSALEVLRQSLASPPSYDEPLETKVVGAGVVEGLPDLVEREDHQAILDLMSAYAKTESVQEKCIDALLILARSDVNKASLLESDAHLTLIAVLRTHSRSTRLLELATGALWHIVLFADLENGQYTYRDHSNDSNKDLLVKQGVPAILVSALRAHPDSVKLARHCCGVFWSLATVDSGKEALAEMSVHTAVLEVMKTHYADPQVQANGCGFLWSIASRKSSQSHLQIAGGRAAVEAALRTFPSAKLVQKYGSLALKKLPE